MSETFSLGRPPIVSAGTGVSLETTAGEVRALSDTNLFEIEHLLRDAADGSGLSSKRVEGADGWSVIAQSEAVRASFDGDGLFLTSLREGTEYDGFDALRDRSVELVARFRERLPERTIGETLVTFVDAMRLPAGESLADSSSRHLTIFPTGLPSEFRGESRSDRRRVEVEDGDWSLTLDAESTAGSGSSEDELGPYVRLYWYVINTRSPKPDDALAAYFDESHERLLRAFRSVFTDAGWALLNPRPH